MLPIVGKEHNSSTLFVLCSKLMTVVLGGAELRMQSHFFFFLVVLTIGCLEAQPEEQIFYGWEVRLPGEKHIFSQIVCLKDNQAALMNSEDHRHILKLQNKSSKSQSGQRVKSQFTYSLIVMFIIIAITF